jgi:hypothetical protein
MWGFPPFWGRVEPGLLLLRQFLPPQPRMMMSVEQSAECLAEETGVHGESLLQFLFVHHKSHMTWSGLEPGLPWWEANE